MFTEAPPPATQSASTARFFSPRAAQSNKFRGCQNWRKQQIYIVHSFQFHSSVPILPLLSSSLYYQWLTTFEFVNNLTTQVHSYQFTNLHPQLEEANMTLPTKATHLKRASLAALSLSFIVIISTPSTRLVSAYQRRPQTQEPLEVHQPPRQPLTCNPEHCDSIVNKCKLTDRCFCEGLKDARCRKDCIDCLEEKFGKCCDCVG